MPRSKLSLLAVFLLVMVQTPDVVDAFLAQPASLGGCGTTTPVVPATLALLPSSTISSRNKKSTTTTFVTTTTTTTRTQLFGAKMKMDGAGRGVYLMAIVLAINIWLFSIPPSFRRAKICVGDPAETPQVAVGDCVTSDQWIADVKDYYKNGGGIQWDFSIDPQTLAKNEKTLKDLLGNK